MVGNYAFYRFMRLEGGPKPYNGQMDDCYGGECGDDDIVWFLFLVSILRFIDFFFQIFGF